MKQLLNKEVTVTKTKSRKHISAKVSVVSLNFKKFVGKKVIVKVFSK